MTTKLQTLFEIF